MRRGLLVVGLAGCNQLFGLQTTQLASDADTPAQLCDPLPFDPNRYHPFDASNSGGVSWAAARSACQSYGYDLAVIDDKDTAEITNELQGAPVPFWLGVTFTGTEWTAIDGCPPLVATGPGAGPSVGDCLLVAPGGMSAFDCTFTVDASPISALCEAPRPSPQCRAFGAQRDYAVASTAFQPRDAAEQACATMGFHLPVIDSTDEIMAIGTMFPNVPKFWIGERRSQTTWTSANGCPAVFTWGSNEPTPSPQDCAYVDGGTMHADYCNGQTDAAVLCERNQ